MKQSNETVRKNGEVLVGYNYLWQYPVAGRCYCIDHWKRVLLTRAQNIPGAFKTFQKQHIRTAKPITVVKMESFFALCTVDVAYA